MAKRVTHPTAKPKRLSLSEIVEMLLTRGGSDRSSITLSRDARGGVGIEVKIRAGDASAVETVEQAEAKAREVYDRLRDTYPVAATHDGGAVSLSRNAKGETQIEATLRTGTEEGPTLARASEQVQETYDNLRMRYPLASGLTAKPGSVE